MFTFPLNIKWQCNAGIAQLVERNLAQVEVEGSRPFSRSRILKRTKAFLLPASDGHLISIGW